MAAKKTNMAAKMHQNINYFSELYLATILQFFTIYI